jgi:apolipoprotein N-acyltransferase
VTAGLLHALALRSPPWSALAWVALVPFLAVAAQAPPRLVVGAAVAYSVTLFELDVTTWLAPTVARYFALPVGRAVTITTAGIAAGSVAYALLLGGACVLRRRAAGRLGVVWCAAAWPVWEALRSYVPPFLPVSVLGTTAGPSLLQLASVTGIAGVSAVMVAVNAGIAGAVVGRRRAPLAAAVAVAIAATAWGAYRMGTAAAVAPGAPRVLLVDGAAADQRESTLARYARATRLPAGPPPALVVWPESALWVDFAGDHAAWTQLSRFVEGLGTTLVTGGLGTEVGRNGTVERFNSVHVIRPRHGMRSYHKRVLIPLAESWPDALGAAPAVLDPVAAGRTLPVFDENGVVFGPLVCFEITDAASARALARQGAAVIVNVNNDVWFAGGRTPHTVWARVRAVESGRPVVRATNRGTSAIVDPFGRVVASARADGEPVTLDAVVPPPVETVYARVDDAFLLACLAVVVGGVLPRRRVTA